VVQLFVCHMQYRACSANEPPMNQSETVHNADDREGDHRDQSDRDSQREEYDLARRSEYLRSAAGAAVARHLPDTTGTGTLSQTEAKRRTPPTSGPGGVGAGAMWPGAITSGFSNKGDEGEAMAVLPGGRLLVAG